MRGSVRGTLSNQRSYRDYVNEPNREVPENENTDLPNMWLLPRKIRYHEGKCSHTELQWNGISVLLRWMRRNVR